MAESHRIRKKKYIVHLSDNEFEMLNKKAEYCGVTKAEYLRILITDGAIINYQPYKTDMKALCYEINRIGNNINQIANRVNSFSAISISDFEDLKKKYDDLLELYVDSFLGSDE